MSLVAGMPEEAGCSDGMCTEARLNQPGRLIEMREGLLVAVDTGNHRIVSLNPRSGGALTTHAGTGQPGFVNGPGDKAQFCCPSDLVEYRDDGSVVVCDTHNHALRLISSSQHVTTFAGTLPRIVFLCQNQSKMTKKSDDESGV